MLARISGNAVFVHVKDFDRQIRWNNSKAVSPNNYTMCEEKKKMTLNPAEPHCKNVL